jgi:hypothetical protein
MAEEEHHQERHDRRERQDPPSWRPIPDPTTLTTEALNREVAALREIIEEKIAALGTLTATQFVDLRRFYDNLLSEKDSRYTERFDSSQKAIDNAARSVREALEAALAATKESVGKSEVSTLKQADSTFVKIDALQSALAKVIPREESERAWSEIDRRLSDHDTRLTTQEAQKSGKFELVPLAGMVIATLSLIMSIILVVSILTRTGAHP